MDWGQHISEISSTATKTLGFLRRNLAFAPKSTKEVAYKTLVRTKLEYATPVWSPYPKLQINQILESSEDIVPLDLQKMAEHEKCWRILDELEWPPLDARRDKSFLLLFHEIHCGAVYRGEYKVSGKGFHVYKGVTGFDG